MNESMGDTSGAYYLDAPELPMVEYSRRVVLENTTIEETSIRVKSVSADHAFQILEQIRKGEGKK